MLRLRSRGGKRLFDDGAHAAAPDGDATSGTCLIVRLKVLIKNGRCAAIGAPGQIAIPATAKKMAGIVDIHTHVNVLSAEIGLFFIAEIAGFAS